MAIHTSGLSREARVEDYPLSGGSHDAILFCPLHVPRYFINMSGSQQDISLSQTLQAQGPQFFSLLKRCVKEY